MAAEGGGRTLYRSLALGVLLFLLLQPLTIVSGAAPSAETPNRVKVAFIRNFAHYVAWPDNPADLNTPWRIGILGKDPLGEVMEKLLKGRTERDRTFEVYQADSLAALPPCQIIYITYRDAALRRAALAALQQKPVLTVGDASTFLQEGGIIRFDVGERMRMSINLDQARAVSLNIPTQMLEVSTEVVENGRVRKVR